jgi:hypothetical protein
MLNSPFWSCNIRDRQLGIEHRPLDKKFYYSIGTSSTATPLNVSALHLHLHPLHLQGSGCATRVRELVSLPILAVQTFSALHAPARPHRLFSIQQSYGAGTPAGNQPWEPLLYWQKSNTLFCIT